MAIEVKRAICDHDDLRNMCWCCEDVFEKIELHNLTAEAWELAMSFKCT